MGFPKESIRSVVSADDGNLKSRHKAIQRFTQNEQCEVCLGIGRLFFGSSSWNFASKAARDFVGSMISTKSLNWKNVSQMTDADHAWTGYDRSRSAEHLPLDSEPEGKSCHPDRGLPLTTCTRHATLPRPTERTPSATEFLAVVEASSAWRGCVVKGGSTTNNQSNLQFSRF